MTSFKKCNIEIFGKEECGYTQQALQLLKQENRIFSFEHINNIPLNKKQIIPSYHKTVPCVFICGKFIGGYTELKEKLDADKKN